VNTAQTVEHLYDDEKGVRFVDTLGGEQKAWFV